MSSEDEAVAWLRAQIEGDKALAERVAARYVGPPDSSRPGERIWPAPSIEVAWQRFEDPDVRAGLDFVQAHNPRDVIADCAAKLGLLDEHGPFDPASEWLSAFCRCCGEIDSRRVAWPCRTVRLIASAYRRREGWRKRWGLAARTAP